MASVAAPVEDPGERFSDMVALALDGPVLRYSQRQKLLGQAGRMGIGRFQANLLIASVLHEKGIGQEYELPPARKWAGPVVAFVLTQGAVLAGVWWVMG